MDGSGEVSPVRFVDLLLFVPELSHSAHVVYQSPKYVVRKGTILTLLLWNRRSRGRGEGALCEGLVEGVRLERGILGVEVGFTTTRTPSTS